MHHMWHSRVSWLALFVLWCGSGAVSQVQGEDRPPPLSPFYRTASNAVASFTTNPNAVSTAAFRAVVSREWLPGLVPLFSVEKGGFNELRRLPGRGQENFSEPLFFALPAAGETNSARTAGRWEAAATRADGSKHRLALELAVDGNRVAARFDQNTDYRFAFIESGLVRTNRLTLEVRYINDSYQLLLDDGAGRWNGRWRRTDDTEVGSLELTRALGEFVAPAGAKPVALHECRREGEPHRLYLRADEPVPPGWKRNAEALCQVWVP